MIKSGEDKLTRLISIGGYCDCGFAYYIAKILADIGNSVMVLDNSKKHDLYQSLAGEEDPGVVDTANGKMVVMKDIAFSLEPFSKVDYVISWLGTNLDPELWKYSDLRILAANYDRFEMEDLKGRLEGLRKDVHLVFVDKIQNKVKEDDVADFLGVDKVDLYVNGGYQTVDMDIVDKACYQAFQYNKRQSLKAFSQPYKEVITEAVQYFYPDKKFAKDLKKIVVRID